jgi:hypothetical protein
MATIKEMALKNYPDHPTNKELTRSRRLRRIGFEFGANAVLMEVEKYIQNLNLGNSVAEKFYKLDVIADIGLFIKGLKGE